MRKTSNEAKIHHFDGDAVKRERRQKFSSKQELM